MACPEDLIKEPGKQMRTVWDIPNNKGRDELVHGKHPTQKPLRLLKRMLALSAKEGQLLLSPFAGSGSDCVAAADLGIRFLGFETDPQYVDVCMRRLAAKSAAMPIAAGPNGENASTVCDADGSGEVRWTPRRRQGNSVAGKMDWKQEVAGTWHSEANADLPEVF